MIAKCVICDAVMGKYDLGHALNTNAESAARLADVSVCAGCWWAYDDAEVRAYVLGLARFEQYRESLLQTESSEHDRDACDEDVPALR